MLTRLSVNTGIVCWVDGCELTSLSSLFSVSPLPPQTTSEPRVRRKTVCTLLHTWVHEHQEVSPQILVA